MIVFGVVVGGSLEQFIDKHLSHDQSLVSKAHRLNDRASLGVITYEEQLNSFAEMAGISLEQVHEEMDNNPRNSKLLEYIKNNLHNKYKIGFLSNASDNWLDELFEKDDIRLFDDIVLSYEVKKAKPDIEIYDLAADRLNVLTKECVFIDDIERYCAGAGLAGMKSVCYRNFGQMKEELEHILSGDLDK